MLKAKKTKLNLALFHSLFLDGKSVRFLIGATLGLAFSISIILTTFGIMNGFTDQLRSILKKSESEVAIIPRFDATQGYDREKFDQLDSYLISKNAQAITHLYQTEGLALANSLTKAVLIQGIEAESFQKVIGSTIELGLGEVGLGSELMHELQIKVGDEVHLAFLGGNPQENSLPTFKYFKVAKKIETGLYEKDSRLVYLNKTELLNVFGKKDFSNLILLNIGGEDTEISRFVREFRGELGTDFSIYPYWYNFSGLLEAIKVEKSTIALILQVVVVVSIFNLMAFIFWIHEKKAKEFFLLMTLGLSLKKIKYFWINVIVLMWLCAILFSIIFIQFYQFAFTHLSVLSLPAKVYKIGGPLIIQLNLNDYIIVCLSTLVWIILILWWTVLRRNKTSLLQNLRREFR